MSRLLLCSLLVLSFSCDQQTGQTAPETGDPAPDADSPATTTTPQTAPRADPEGEEPAKTPLPKIASLTFTDHSEGLPQEGHFAGIAMADLDGDGQAELLSGRREEAQGLFLFQLRDGKWEQHQLTDVGDYGGVRLADLTGDGVPDVLAVKTAGRPKGLELFETEVDDGTLTFTPLPSPYTDGSDDLDVGDLDGDGDLDLVLSSRGDRVFVNDGTGRDFDRIDLDSGVYEDTGVLLADVNSDGLHDVLSANHPGEPVRLFLGKGKEPVRFSERHTTGIPLHNDIGFKLAAADFNADGHPDLAVGTRGGLLLFHGNGCQGPEESWWSEQAFAGRSSQTIQPVLADLDRDGDPDLVYTSEQGLQVRLNNGSGTFGERLAGPAIPGQGSYSGCCVADWDQDGDLDIAISSFQGNGIRLLLNTP